MDDTVREEDVGLDDLRGGVARGDEVAGRVEHEGERLARGGRAVRAAELRRVDGRPVDELDVGKT